MKKFRASFAAMSTKLEKATDAVTHLRARLKLRDLETEVATLRDQQTQLMQKAKAGEKTDGLSTAQKDLDKIRNKLKVLDTQLGEKTGIRKTKQAALQGLRARLLEPDYKNIVVRFHEKQIETSTVKLARDDCESYYKELDAGLMEFHQLKIREINERVRELWKLTYQGGDIDSIELVSEASATASRSYEYKLVMNRGDTELEMRGRCSAGQKMLASLIIRLALAETFSVNCGILTLDEPTTNLDHANRTGLAEAIAKLIESKPEKHRNFQLIIITHDEDFVNCLREAGIERFDFFHKVSREQRNGKFYSRIEKVDISQ